jgi:hypothetical protein
MLSKHFKADGHAAPRPHWRLWVFVAALAVGCPVLHNWQQHHESRLAAEHSRRAASSQARMREKLAPIYARQDARFAWANRLDQWAAQFNSSWFSQMVRDTAGSALNRRLPISRRQLELQLNNGVPFQTTQVSRDWGCGCHSPVSLPFDMAVYTPPGGGAPFRLYFSVNGFVHAEDAALSEYKPLWGSRACGVIDQTWLSWGPRLWMLMIVLPFALRRHRVWLAELVTAVSLLLLVGVLPRSIGLPGSPAWDMLVRDARVAWAMFALATSAAVLVWAFLRQSNVSRITCSLCGYNLRGNTTGTCPECGTSMSPEVRGRLAGI